MKIGFVSLGCPKNQLDTEVMLHEIITAGYEVTPEDIEADVIIVNTCAFIESAKQEAIDNILDVAWLKKHRSLKAALKNTVYHKSDIPYFYLCQKQSYSTVRYL